MAAVTNSSIDVLAALVVATPLTRVTDIDTLPFCDDETVLEFNVTASSTRVFMNKNQLADLNVVAAMVERAEGIPGAVQRLKTKLLAIANTTIGTTYTQETYSAAIQDLKEIMETRGMH